MYNILRSVHYTMRRDMVVWLAIPGFLILPFLFSLLDGAELKELTASYYAVQEYTMMTAMFAVIVNMVFSCKAAGGDASDRTLNYELMTGHSRSSVFAARIVAGICWGALLLTLLEFVFPLVLYAWNGWGPETRMRDVLFRIFLCFFPNLRLTAFYIMLSVVLQSAGKGIALSYLSLIPSVMTVYLEELMDVSLAYLTGITNLNRLLILENAREIVENGKRILRYDAVLPEGLVKNTILFSLAAASVYLLIAYIYFVKKDRN